MCGVMVIEAMKCVLHQPTIASLMAILCYPRADAADFNPQGQFALSKSPLHLVGVAEKSELPLFVIVWRPPDAIEHTSNHSYIRIHETQRAQRGTMAASLNSRSLLSLVVLFTLSFSPIPAHSGSCNKDDKKALFAFMNSFGSPPKFPTWTNTFACCEWYGVQCDDTGRVYSLDIINDDTINSPIPSAIGDLPTLQVLRLHKLPNLPGPIPLSITKLHHLRFLTISWTGISGPVPAFLSSLTALESIDFSFNNLSGAIPAALGVLPSLYGIDISRNRLTGAIPSTLFKKVQIPADLVLSHNQLTGPIPQSFGNISFASLDLSRNHLTGDASFLFGEGKGVNIIDLSRNQLEFNLTKVRFPVAQLDGLNLDHNKIYGTIPAQITQLKQLQFFNVSYNRLCGEIPTGGRMAQFDEYCYVHNKCLCGAPLQPCK